MYRYLIIFVITLCYSTQCLAVMLDQPAKAVELPPPSYPDAEKREGRGGLATVVIRVDENGSSSIERVMGSLYPFTAAAKSAAKNWKFTPAIRDRKPASFLLEFIVVFDPKKGVEILGPLFP